MKKLLIVAGVAAGVLLLIGLWAVGPLLSPSLKDKVTSYLATRFQSKAELRDLRVSIFPIPQISGEELVLHHRGRTDLPPLIAIEQFQARAGYIGLMRRPRHIGAVGVKGLRIHIPPRSAGRPLIPRSAEGSQNGSGRSQPAAGGSAAEPETRGTPVVIDQITSENAAFEIAPKDPSRPPKLFAISRLTLQDVGADRPMRFNATLANPKPPGAIQSNGEFGPWQGAEPATTPVRGEYVFENADLGVFKGIDGTLNSRGRYDGILERIAVKGEATVPDFTLTVAGNPVDLKTAFDAIVDGTNGNTLLQPVKASFLKTSLVANGGVIRTPGKRGREIQLDVKIAPSRIEDLLRLAMKGERPLMKGAAVADTKLRIPPGEEDVVDKLELDGAFHIAEATFPDLNVQRTLAKLSARSRGLHDADPGESVVSELKGTYRMRDGRLTFSSLTFAIPGASVHLAGSYALRSEELDFKGKVRLQARLSETFTGVKAVLLKIIDPLFRGRGAGAEIPIRITGVRSKPKFGLDLGEMMPGP